MKVCHYIASTGLGRGEIYIDLVNALCRHMDIVLLVPRDARFRHRIDQAIEVVEYRRADSRYNPFLLYELHKKFQGIAPHIVHTHFAKASLIFHRLNKSLRLPHVATKHNPRKGRIYEKLPHVIAVSAAVKASIAHGNVRIIHNGLVPEDISEPKTKNDLFTICAVGRLEKIKGYDILVRACSRLPFDYRLQLVGDGSERKALENLVKDLRIEEKIHFMGFRRDVPQIIHQSDLSVVSSHSEGFSLAALEAIFHGDVLLSTKTGIMPEILPENFLTDHERLGEKIADIAVRYEAYRREFLILKNQLKPRFLLENIVLEHMDYYRQLLAGKLDAHHMDSNTFNAPDAASSNAAKP
uniref:Glycosyltransferase involved in cell wall bisynthesis n=1 Tax=Candidatus Kentrum sp. SD TaxID=2126332 RepID=A0A451BI58_9GAMM|nr:MAG: Glycosyltransferase involved in cell wall bisynthesis [Candidatus Kentron sp. SD]